ncbi:replication factor-A carboxy-terminal domain protein, partial [Trifolium pratense]
MTGISTMERQPSLLKDVHNGKELWKIAIKVKDKWNIVRDGKQSFEIVVVDCKGDAIVVIVPHELNATLDPTIVEKNSYTFQNFQVLKNDDQFKLTDHKFKLRLTGGTRVSDVNRHDIPYPMPKFKDFVEIAAGKWREDLLYDIIGVVDDIGYTQAIQGTRKVQANFRLKDL